MRPAATSHTQPTPLQPSHLCKPKPSNLSFYRKQRLLSMKRGTGGKEPGEHCWILFAIIGNGFQLLGKRHMAAVLGAQTQGETHRQNDTSLAGRPKDTNPYPWRDPYRGGGASRRPRPLCGFLYMGLSMGTGFVYMGCPGRPLHGYGLVHSGRPAGFPHLLYADVSFFLWVSPWV